PRERLTGRWNGESPPGRALARDPRVPGRLAVRYVADEGLVHTVEPAIDPVVEHQLLLLLLLGRVLEVEAAAGVPLVARERRAGREEARSEERRVGKECR